MLSTIFFPDLLEAFLEKHPDVPVMLEEYGSIRACDLVQNDTLDLALVNMEQYSIDKFYHIILADDQIVFCVGKGHRLAEKEAVTIHDIAKESLILFNGDSVQNQLLKNQFELNGYKPHIVMRGSQIYTTIQFLKTNRYSGFLYSSMTDKFPDIIRIPLLPQIPVRIGIVWKKGKYISNDMQTFLNFTKKYYKEHPLIGR